jgi:hypothetical protein
VASPSSSNPYEWRGRTANGYELQIERVPTGMWRVIYGGFSRSTSASLVAALGEATGSPTSAAWISTLVERLSGQQDPPAAPAVIGAIEMLGGKVGGSDNESDLRRHEAQVGPAEKAAARAQ